MPPYYFDGLLAYYMLLIEVFLGALLMDFVTSMRPMVSRIGARRSPSSMNQTQLALSCCTTYVCGGTGLDMHRQCHRFVTLEPSIWVSREGYLESGKETSKSPSRDLS